MEMEFSIGIGNHVDVSRVLACSDKIKTIYTGGLKDYIAGGRPQYNESLEMIESKARIVRDNGKEFEITLNAPCGIPNSDDKSWWVNFREYLTALENIGVTGIIASHPFIISEVKTHSKLKVTASTICEIMNARAALYYEKLGADIIVPSMNCNYRLSELLSIKKALTRATIKIMVNEPCLGDCPWRRFHHSHYAHSSCERDYHIRCKKVYLDNPELYLTNNVIRPEDLYFYKEITNYYKLVGRTSTEEVICKRIKAYSTGTWEGNYLELFDEVMAKKIYIPNGKLNDLLRHKINCSKECFQCTKCNEYAGLIDKR